LVRKNKGRKLSKGSGQRKILRDTATIYKTHHGHTISTIQKNKKKTLGDHSVDDEGSCVLGAT
jgi:hypothetical protein